MLAKFYDMVVEVRTRIDRRVRNSACPNIVGLEPTALRPYPSNDLTVSDSLTSW